MVHHAACPLCGSSDISLNSKSTDNFVSKKEFDVFKCNACDFHFTQDYPEETEIAKFYESESYISHSNTSEGFSNKLYLIARGVMLGKKKSLILKLTGLKTGTLLDIGSGTGYFAAAMKKTGWNAEGIEINEKARNFSRSHFGIETNGPDKILSYAPASFDCITLWHVLEHLHDPFYYAHEIYRLLKPGAYCVIALPNCNSYDAMFYKQFWAAWDVPRHLWHFSSLTFRLFAEKSGFILESIKILPMDVFYISFLSEKNKGFQLPLLKGMTIAVAFAFLSAFRKNKSSSLIYMLRKPEDKILS